MRMGTLCDSITGMAIRYFILCLALVGLLFSVPFPSATSPVPPESFRQEPQSRMSNDKSIGSFKDSDVGRIDSLILGHYTFCGLSFTGNRLIFEGKNIMPWVFSHLESHQFEPPFYRCDNVETGSFLTGGYIDLELIRAPYNNADGQEEYQIDLVNIPTKSRRWNFFVSIDPNLQKISAYRGAW
jgi:hypothetical protein